MIDAISFSVRLEALRTTNLAAAVDEAYEALEGSSDEAIMAAAEFLDKYNLYPTEDGGSVKTLPNDPVTDFLRSWRADIDSEVVCPTRQKFLAA